MSQTMTKDQLEYLKENAPHLLAGRPRVLDEDHLDYLNRHAEMMSEQISKLKTEISESRKYRGARAERESISRMREIVNEIDSIHDYLDNDLGDEE